MSSLSIREYFPFSRVKITKQSVLVEDKLVMIYLEPDNRFTPVCHVCGSQARKVHSQDVRTIRDLTLALVVVRLVCWFRKVYCTKCAQIVVEGLEFVRPYQRVTLRLAQYIHELCKMLTVAEAAEHLGLDWKTVKNIDKVFLEGAICVVTEFSYSASNISTFEEVIMARSSSRSE
ncbi:MAG: hypothetical protein JRG97_15495 [Deltaproteobacteria bacterium]|nr:hypothetical protein [Deltaproteobacteria bacterium]